MGQRTIISHYLRGLHLTQWYFCHLPTNVSPQKITGKVVLKEKKKKKNRESLGFLFPFSVRRQLMETHQYTANVCHACVRLYVAILVN